MLVLIYYNLHRLSKDMLFFSVWLLTIELWTKQKFCIQTVCLNMLTLVLILI